jgi:uncharacterized protein YwgA
MYKIEEIIEALLFFAGSQDIKTKIVKACYLLESEYFDKTGQRLTDVEYKYHLYGPYSEVIVTSMMNDKNISYSAQTSMNGNDYDLFKLKETSVISKIDPLTLSLIEKWAKVMQQNTLEEILKLAYSDKNFVKTEKGKVINFDSDFLRKKQLLKKRVKEKFKNRKLTKEEAEGLKAAGNEDLIQYSRSLLRESRG